MPTRDHKLSSAEVGHVRFHYDRSHDIHFVYPKWTIETEDDCKVWFRQFVDYFSRFATKVDVVILLDEFRIGPRIGTVWGKYRSDWIKRYTRYSVRVHADARVKVFNATSAALYGGGFEEARTVDEAVAAIQQMRLGRH